MAKIRFNSIRTRTIVTIKRNDQQYENHINSARKIPESLARTIEPVGDKIDKGKYFQIIQGLLSTNPDTFGVGIWYEH